MLSASTAPAPQLFFLGLAMELLGMAVLALVPIPPLELGVRLSSWPPALGRLAARRAYHLLEKNVGRRSSLLVLLLLPLGGQPPSAARVDRHRRHAILVAF